MSKLHRIEIGKDTYIVHNSHNVATLYLEGIYSGWNKSLLLSSDRHHDSPKCDREFELEHLREVKERGAFILDVGDCFDVMQGRYDPRRTYSGLRPEYAVDNYLNAITTEAKEFYSPYADRFLVIGRGNHEQSILKNNGFDLTSVLVDGLNSAGGHVQAGGYTGWLRILFLAHKTQRMSVLVKYAHGFGAGNAQVTRNVIQSNRQAVYEPDADIVVNGHVHETWHVPIARERISDKGVVYQDLQHHLRTATYDNDYGDGHSGWHVESGKPPKPRGAVWLNLSYKDDAIEVNPVLAIK